MPQALVTTEPNQPREIVSTEFGNENGWVGIGKHFHLLGIWQWLAWNRLKFLSQLIAASLYRVSGNRYTRREWKRLEERRRDRESLRSYLKHYKHSGNCIKLAILVMLWISERLVQSFWDCLRKETELRSRSRTLKPPPCFCKGLSGFARTDSTVPAISF